MSRLQRWGRVHAHAPGALAARGLAVLLLSACATSTPGRDEKKQLAPVGSLVGPKPIPVPVQMGLPPPAPLIVVPEGEPAPSPESSPDREPAPALTVERELARTCGFDFRVGVRSAAHQAALLNVDRTLTIVVMDWC